MEEAFFVRSASPGAVLRFLERLARRGEAVPAELLLSDAVGESLWRALPVSGLEALAPRLAHAFPPEVLQLRKTPDGWQWARYDADGLTAQGALRKKHLWERVEPVALWARSEGVPLARLIHPPKVLDYTLVAQLDQRSLLIENTPRLYRFQPELSS